MKPIEEEIKIIEEKLRKLEETTPQYIWNASSPIVFAYVIKLLLKLGGIKDRNGHNNAHHLMEEICKVLGFESEKYEKGRKKRFIVKRDTMLSYMRHDSNTLLDEEIKEGTFLLHLMELMNANIKKKKNKNGL